MTPVSYGLHKELPDVKYEDAITRVTEALKAEGFGILTEIDVAATLKKKLDVDVPRYVILGACNPKMAHQALGVEPWIGLLLPCNVVVAERPDGGSNVAAINPDAMFQVVANEDVKSIAGQVNDMLSRAINAL